MRHPRAASPPPPAPTPPTGLRGGSATRARPDRPATLPALAAIAGLVGRTPMLAIDLKLRGRHRRVHAKAEYLNLTGSIKDRMALHVLGQAVLRGELRPGDTIAEATSGNTGISVCAVGRALGCEVEIFMPDWLSRERMALIGSFGARLRLVSREEGGFLGAIRLTQELAAARPRVYLPRQFDNPANVEAHALGTGPEILAQLAHAGLAPRAFVAGVGTGGTVMGVGRALRTTHPGVRIHPLEPAESPTLSAGHKVGSHRIQGISDEFVPSICHLRELDAPVAVHDGDAILLAQRLARELGLGVGISSGANLLGALRVQDDLGDEATVVTLLCDDNKKYLSTDLMRDEPSRAGYLSPEVELLGYTVIPAVKAN
jgi:cysteine synthase A